MTQKERDLLMGKVLNAPDALSDREIDQLMHDQELREMYDLAVLLRSGAAKPTEQKHQSSSAKSAVHRRRRPYRWAAMVALFLSLGAVAAISLTRHLAERASEVTERSELLEVPESLERPDTTTVPVAEERRLTADLIFENLSLAEIAERVEEVFGYKVKIADKELASFRFYLTLPKGSTAATFVSMIDAYSVLSATVVEGEIFVQKPVSKSR